MAKGAQLLEIIYADTQETAAVMITLGDTVRAQDWAEQEYPNAPRRQEERAGLYAVYLGAKRLKMRGTEGDWLAWLDQVTIPDDGEEHDVPEPGETEGPQSEQ